MIKEKKCAKCKVTSDNFYININKHNGKYFYSGYCKSCTAKVARDGYKRRKANKQVHSTKEEIIIKPELIDIENWDDDRVLGLALLLESHRSIKEIVRYAGGGE